MRHVLKCLVPVPDAFHIVSRLATDEIGAPTLLQTLIASGRCLRPLFGAEGREGLELGPPLQLHEAALMGEEGPARRAFSYPVWDVFSASLLFSHGGTIIRVVGNVVTLVAGHVEEEGEVDGSGAAARFLKPASLTSDSAGVLYCADARKVRKIQLPATWRAEAGVAGSAAAAAAACEEAVVTTLPFQADRPINGLAYIPGRDSAESCGGDGGALVFATYTALYRVPMGAAANPVPALLAGREEVYGDADGPGADARFQIISGLAVDSGGCIIAADLHVERHTTTVRRVAPDGTVTTVAAGLDGIFWRPAILPNGYLALAARDGDLIVVLDLGLKQPPLRPLASPPPRTLPADLGALLDAQPDGSADLTIVVGGRTFAVHRGILSARCDYFRQRLTGGTFADGSAAQLSLPDTDSATFSLLLRFLYMGTADIPAELACAVAELADRLLLPELCAGAQAQVLAAVTPATVVGSLLWAMGCEARGPGFSQLLSGLKAWYVENYEAVRREAGDSVMRLVVEAPVLAVELMDLGLGAGRSAQRHRT